MTNGTPPKVSLITVVRNGATHIERCLRSVEQQSYDNIEYIVLDGASTDGTQAIIQQYISSLTVYCSRPDNGPYHAAMQGLAVATGEIVGFVMADDWLSVDAVESVVKMYNGQPNADIFCFGVQEHRQVERNAFVTTRVFLDPPGKRFTLLEGIYCHGVNRFYSTRLLQREGFRDSQYPQMADRDLYVRLGLLRVRKAWTPEILYHFVVHPGSNTTGGSNEKVVRLLSETSQIASDFVANPKVAKSDERLLIRWYCFNQVRMCWFLLKCRRPGRAVSFGIRLVSRHPIATLIALVRWHIPKPLRPVACSSDKSESRCVTA